MAAIGDVVAFMVAKLLLGGDANGLIDRVGEQALFRRVNRIEQAFAAEIAVFHDGEGATVEREAGGVGLPVRAERCGFARRPERKPLGIDLGLQDRHHRGLVLADGDGLGKVIGEIVIEGGGGCVGSDGTTRQALVVRVLDDASVGGTGGVEHRHTVGHRDRLIHAPTNFAQASSDSCQHCQSRRLCRSPFRSRFRSSLPFAVPVEEAVSVFAALRASAGVS